MPYKERKKDFTFLLTDFIIPESSHVYLLLATKFPNSQIRIEELVSVTEVRVGFTVRITVVDRVKTSKNNEFLELSVVFF